MKKSRKDDVVLKASCLIRQNGYTNLSFSQIAKDLDITRENVHHYFKKKEDLGLACLEYMYKDLEDKFEVILNSSSSNNEKINNYFMNYKQNQSSKEDCPIVPLLSEYDLLPTKIQDFIKLLSDLEIEKLALILEEGRKNKDFFFNETSKEKAKAVLALLKGAVSYNKIYGNFKDISELVLKDLQNK